MHGNPAAGEHRRLRLLVVDDSPHFRVAAKTLFESSAQVLHVDTVDSGEAALEIILGGGEFDLLVLDLSMQGLSGLDVARRLRGLPQSPRIVMVSLYDEPEFRSAARHAGVEEFIDKVALAAGFEPLLERLFGVTA